jgi:tetratricopeptide (TPR) repeat protein
MQPAASIGRSLILIILLAGVVCGIGGCMSAKRLGLAYAREGQLDQALAAFSSAIEKDPKDAEVYSNRGVIYAAKGFVPQAFADYDRALALNPHFAPASLNKARLLERMGRIAESLAVYRDAVGYLGPDDASLSDFATERIGALEVILRRHQI